MNHTIHNSVTFATQTNQQTKMQPQTQPVPTTMPTSAPLRLHLLLLGFFFCIYILPLGVRPLMEPDETRYAVIPLEMITTGNWISPHLNGLRYFEKPPLGYWLNAVSILVFGKNEFAVRLPSALSAGFTALLILLLTQKFCPQHPRAGLITALIFLTTLEIPIVGTFAILDSLLTATLTLTIACFFVAAQADRGSSRRTRFLIIAGFGCGLAFLTKGFLALVVPALTVGAYLIWERRWRDLFALAWLPLIVATLTVLPWGLAIHRLEPDFWNYFFWQEHVQRFLGGKHAQHPEPFWYFFLFAPAMFLPWTFLVPAAGIGLRKSLNAGELPPQTRQLIRFCLCWLCLPFLFFSFSSGKLITYILPCIPPFTILVGTGLLCLLQREKQPRSLQIGVKFASFFFGFALISFILIQFIGVNKIDPPYSNPGQWLMAIAALLNMTLLPLIASQTPGKEKKFLLFAMAPAVLLAGGAFLIPDATIESKSPGALLLSQKNVITPDTVILSDEVSLRGACWYLQRSDILIVRDAGETTYGISYPEAKKRLIPLPQVKSTILANKGNVVLIAKAKNYRQWIPYLPNPQTIDDNGDDGSIFATF